RDAGRGAMAALAAAMLAACAGGAVLFLALWTTDMDPTEHVYPAMMWALVIWVIVHLIAGVVLQGYCLAGLAFGKITRRHDAPLWNSLLFWHFLCLTVLVTGAMIAIAPRLMT
ncbi:cytochrome ubiquinol oxidase subunit I, partial [Paracoccus rhizosphaerae]